jgi:hypothetical protein
MDEISIPPHAVTAEELVPIVWRRQRKGVILFCLAYSISFTGLAYWALKVDLLWIAAPVLFLGTIVRHRYWTLLQTIRKMDPLIFSNRVMVMREDGFSWTYESGLSSYVPWRLLKKAEIVNGIYLLHLPGGNYFQLPRRALSNDQEHYLVDRLRSIGVLV